MLKNVVEFIDTSQVTIDGGTLFCKGNIILTKEIISALQEEGVIENEKEINTTGSTLELEFSIIHLNSFGYYLNKESYISRNKYKTPLKEYYIGELKCYSSVANTFITTHESVIRLITAIKNISKHHYEEIGIENAILFREDKSSFLPFIYSHSEISTINEAAINKLDLLINAIQEEESEKKLLYLNELIEQLNSKEEAERFSFLLKNVEDFYTKCIDAYQFYLRNFSYNKLKLELDAKTLEYTQKIQGVINDAQTKLIAIPTAFLLVVTVLDFLDPLSLKNMATVSSLIIFSTLIQLFINNQKSSLNFIAENIKSYKESFELNDIEKVSSKFNLVDEELKKQKNRIWIAQFILWFIPISVIASLLLLKYHNQIFN